jgi:hypothetical protein
MDHRAMNPELLTWYNRDRPTTEELKQIVERLAMKTNVSILVNVQGVTVAENAQAVVTRRLADMIRDAIEVTKQLSEHDMPAIEVECDEINGVITINGASQL